MVTSHPLVASSPLVAGVMSRWGVMISITIPSHCIDYVALVGTSFIIHMVYLLLINVNYLSKNISPFLWQYIPFLVYYHSLFMQQASQLMICVFCFAGRYSILLMFLSLFNYVFSFRRYTPFSGRSLGSDMVIRTFSGLKLNLVL
jgi:hypothetical protein